jgi:DNA-binding IclR family transcriptional regulator
MADILTLADPERTLMNWLVRQRAASLADVVAHTQTDSTLAQGRLNALVAAGFLNVDDTADPIIFKLNLVSRQTRSLPDELWQAFD